MVTRADALNRSFTVCYKSMFLTQNEDFVNPV